MNCHLDSLPVSMKSRLPCLVNQQTSLQLLNIFQKKNSNKKRNDDSVPIVVDPVNRLLFFNLRHEAEAMLERIYLDGSHRKKLINKNIRWINGLAVQPNSKILYYAEAMDKHIGYVSYDGFKSGRLLNLINGHPFGFTLLDGYAYWTDWNSLAIQRIPLDGKNKEFVLKKDHVYFTDMKAVDLGRKLNIEELNNPCLPGRNPCSHFCFPLPPPANFSCGCPADEDVTKDGLECHRPPQVLYYLHNNRIGRVNLNMEGDAVMPGWSNQVYSMEDISRKQVTSFSNSMHEIFVQLVGLDAVTKLVIDARHERFIWYDHTTKTVSSSFLNGSGPTVVMSGCYLEDMDYNWISANLYFICSIDDRYGRLEVLSLGSTFSRTSKPNDNYESNVIDNESKKSILKTWQSGCPTVILVHPLISKLYWFYCGRNSLYLELYEADLDAQNERVILKENLNDKQTSPGCPHYAKIDFSEGKGRIYYGHMVSSTIFIYDIQTGLKSSIILPKKSELSAMEIFGDYLYISDFSTFSVYRIPKSFNFDDKNGPSYNLTQILVTKKELSNYIRQLIVVYPNRQPFTAENKPCAVSPALKLTLDESSHITSQRHTILPSLCDSVCIDSSSARSESQCLCPSHYKLRKNGRSCSPPSKFLIAVLKSGRIIRIMPDHMPHDVLLPFSLPPIQSRRFNQQSSGNRAPENLSPDITIKSAVWDPISENQFFYISPDTDTIRTFNFKTGHHSKLLPRDRPSDYGSMSRSPSPDNSLQVLFPAGAFSLAYEPVTKILFWSLPKLSVIVAGKVDPFKILGPVVNTSLIELNGRKPLHVTVLVKSGYIIWSSAREADSSKTIAGSFLKEEWKDFEITRCLLDGYQCKVIVESAHIGYIAAMVVDTQEGSETLYWIDMRNRVIYRKNIWDNDIPTTVVKPALSNAIKLPNSLVIHRNHLFWYDGQLKQASIKNSSRSPNAPVPLHNLQLLTSPIVALLSIDRDPNITCDLAVRHPCSRLYTTCSHFCLPTLPYPYDTPLSLCHNSRHSAQALSGRHTNEAVNFKCSCPHGYILSANSYQCQSDRSCSTEQFLCPNGISSLSPANSINSAYCLPMKYRCDGYTDCKDETDEKNCPQSCNSPHYYQCTDRACIPAHKRCDGFADCDSDESCCGDKFFECRTSRPGENRCKPLSVKCNNYPDCGDGSDEPVSCPSMRMWPNVITIDTHSRTTYTVAIAIAVLGVVLTFGVAGYTCTKRRHRHPYVMRADQVDIMLMPTNDGDNDCRSEDSPPASPGHFNKESSKPASHSKTSGSCSGRHITRSSSHNDRETDVRHARHKHKHKLSVSDYNYFDSNDSCTKSGQPCAFKRSTLKDYMVSDSATSKEQNRSHCVALLPSRTHRSGDSEMSGASSSFCEHQRRVQDTCEGGERCCCSERQRPSGTSSSSSFTNLIQNLGGVRRVEPSSSDVYPQETLNPPPSPITEISYDVAPLNADLQFSNWWYGHHYTGSSLATAVACCFPDENEVNDFSYKHHSIAAAAYKTVTTHHSNNRIRRKRSKTGRSRCRNVRVLIVTTDAPPPTPYSASHLPSTDEDDDLDTPIKHHHQPPPDNQASIEFLPSPPPPPPPPSSTSTVYGPLLPKSKRRKNYHHHHHHHHRTPGSSNNSTQMSAYKKSGHHSRHHKTSNAGKKTSSRVSSDNPIKKPLPPPPSPENESN